jgi:protein-disulfide isomerase
MQSAGGTSLRDVPPESKHPYRLIRPVGPDPSDQDHRENPGGAAPMAGDQPSPIAAAFGYHSEQKFPQSGHLIMSMTKRFLTTLAIVVLGLLPLASAQDLSSVLKPPKGTPVALVVFEDLQCPMCARTAPLLQKAVEEYKIPLVVHDFPLPMHNWSYQAALYARYFDSHAQALGYEFRDYIFANQLAINPYNLRSYVERFAAAHKVDLPFVVDPQGKFAAEINQDRQLGQRIGIQHTPTVYVVSDKGPRVEEVKQPETQLFQMIDAMKQ